MNIEQFLFISMIFVSLGYMLSSKSHFNFLTILVILVTWYQIVIGTILDSIIVSVVFLISIHSNHKVNISASDIYKKLKPRPYFYGLLAISIGIVFVIYFITRPEIMFLVDKKIKFEVINLHSWAYLTLMTTIGVLINKVKND